MHAYQDGRFYKKNVAEKMLSKKGVTRCLPKSGFLKCVMFMPSGSTTTYRTFLFWHVRIFCKKKVHCRSPYQGLKLNSSKRRFTIQ